MTVRRQRFSSASASGFIFCSANGVAVTESKSVSSETQPTNTPMSWWNPPARNFLMPLVSE